MHDLLEKILQHINKMYAACKFKVMSSTESKAALWEEAPLLRLRPASRESDGGCLGTGSSSGLSNASECPFCATGSFKMSLLHIYIYIYIYIFACTCTCNRAPLKMPYYIEYIYTYIHMQG